MSDTCVAIVPLFSGLTYADQLEVARYATPIRRQRGEQIYRAGEAAATLLVVHTGRVKLSHIAPSGQEQLLRVLEPGEFIGEAAYVTGQRPNHTATALTDVQLCSFKHSDLGSLVRAFPDIAMRMLHAVTTRLSETERLLAEISTADVQARIAGYLLDLPGQWVQDDGEAVVKVELPLPKNAIAALLGTSAETLSRRLAGFVEAGLITMRGRHVTVLDPAGLELLVGS
ncbi:MAG TPA: Crp/Fnr family transcriptional regulator [Beutenbergiaceae bacterium]|nr:Crp/Fnr family transcriptional regulator [Beutenbergiaceae bacterium]